MHPIFWLTPVENTFWQRSKYRFQHRSTGFKKEVRNFWILEKATYRRSVIDILKFMIKLLEKYLWRSFFSKVRGNSPKSLLKMNSFTNIFTCSYLIELTSIMYKVNNKESRTTSFDVFLVSFVLTLNRFYALFLCFLSR